MIKITVALILMLGYLQPEPEQLAKSQTLSKEGWKLWQSQQFEQAQVKFEESVQLDPSNTEAWNGLGWARMNQGKPEEAQQAFEKCVELAPKHAAALNGLGWIHFQNGKIDEAEEAWLKSEAPAGWTGLAQVYLLQEKWEEAEKYAQKLVDAGESAGAGEWANKLLQAAKTRKLPHELRNSLQMGATGPAGADIREGWKLFQQGKFDDALAKFESALDQDPESLAAHNGMGWCYFNLGDTDSARSHFQICLEANPDDGAALNGMAFCLQREGKEDEAIELWERMQKLHPGTHAGTHGLAHAYFQRGEYDKALPYLEKIASQSPENDQIAEMLEQAREAVRK